MKLNDAILNETFTPYDEANDPVLCQVYGVVTASVGKMLLLGSLSAMANQYLLVGFSQTRMIMIRLDMLGKPKEPAIIPFSDIRDVQIAGWLFGMGKKICLKLTDGSKIRLKVNGSNVMLKKQKENLNAACELLSGKFGL